MMNGWPRISAILGVTVRATMSVPPPGGNGTMTRIGLDGEGCASALLASASPRAKRHCFSTATSFSGRGSFVGLASMLEDLLRRARVSVAAAGEPKTEALQGGHGPRPL